MNKSFLEKLQECVGDALLMNIDFADIPVVPQMSNFMSSAMLDFAEADLGMSVVVLMPEAGKLVSNREGLDYQDVTLGIRVTESAEINLTGRTAMSVAESIAQTLHHFQPEIEGWRGWLELDEKRPIKRVKDKEKLNRDLVEVQFHVKGGRTSDARIA